MSKIGIPRRNLDAPPPTGFCGDGSTQRNSLTLREITERTQGGQMKGVLVVDLWRGQQQQKKLVLVAFRLWYSSAVL